MLVLVYTEVYNYIRCFLGFKVEKIKKTSVIFSKVMDYASQLKLTKKSVDYLDVTLDLNNSKYKPFNKPNSVSLYVNSKSNHPRKIINNLTAAINNRLCTISSDKDTFEASSGMYQTALNNSGYN